MFNNKLMDKRMDKIQEDLYDHRQCLSHFNLEMAEVKTRIRELSNQIIKNGIRIGPSLNHVEAINPKIVHELEKLREFLHGAHFTAENENASATLHQACHKVDDLISLAKLE